MGATETTSRTPLTEDEFWEKLEHQDAQSSENARKLIDYYQDKDGIHLKPRQNSIAVHLFTPESGQRISLFIIRTVGVIECWHTTVGDQLDNGGLNRELMMDYVSDLKPMLNQQTKSLSIYPLAKDVDVEAFKLAIDRLIDRVMQAEPD
jgi:hypothetical protein